MPNKEGTELGGGTDIVVYELGTRVKCDTAKVEHDVVCVEERTVSVPYIDHHLRLDITYRIPRPDLDLDLPPFQLP